jgi:O-antigen biosynthesis protein
VRPYLVWSFDYYPDSAGQKTMHRLCHELNRAGQTAFVAYEKRNPDWKTPFRSRRWMSGDWIAVYPEIVKGNPWKAPRVVRYVLNNPGKLGGDTTYAPSEIVYVFHELFNDPGVPPERIMFLPTIELDIYTDRHEPREGALYYVGKGQKTRDLDAVELTNDMKRDGHNLADLLNRATVLYTFDNVTAMTIIARLCGCPVVLIPDGTYIRETFDEMVASPGLGWDEMPEPFDSDVIRANEVAQYEAFRERLTDFIRVTQA